MTTLALADRVQETAQNITNTAAITLLGASAANLQSFQAAGLDGATVPYLLVHETSAQWEIGEGVYTAAGHQLARTTVFSNSLGTTARIAFVAGVVDVILDAPAEKLVMFDADSSALTLPGPLALNGAAASMRPLNFLTSGLLRWQFCADNTAESGSNAGSNIAFSRYADDGSFLGSPVAISRQYGTVEIGDPATPVANIMLGVFGGPSLVGATQYGIAGVPTFHVGATIGVALYSYASVWDATLTTAYGHLVGSAAIAGGHGGSIATAYGTFWQAQSVATANYIWGAATDGGTSSLSQAGVLSLGGAASGGVSMTLLTAATGFGGSAVGAQFKPVLTAAANADSLVGMNLQATFTNASKTGLFATQLAIGAIDVSSWTTPADVKGINIGALTGKAGMNAFGIRFSPISGGANNYLLATSDLATFLVTAAGAGTFLAGITVGSNTNTGPNAMTINGAAGSYRELLMLTAGLLRWAVLTNTAAESGTNAGSDFVIARYTDGGAFIANALSITRSNGLTTINSLAVPLGAGSGVVSAGAPDSGGTGFRLLRVPN